MATDLSLIEIPVSTYMCTFNIQIKYHISDTCLNNPYKHTPGN